MNRIVEIGLSTTRLAHSSFARLAAPLLWLCLSVTTLQAQTTAFNYQGKLASSGNPATGQYDFLFKLYDTQMVGTGTQQGADVTVSNITVTAGVFTAQIDFGVCAPCFNGSARFLEIAVKLNGGGSFTTLSPRQPITSNPYALRSPNAAAADGLSVACVNCVTSSQIGSLPADSGNYIQNTATLQASSNFNISGNGFIGGNVGIGTTNPSSTLAVQDGAGPGGHIQVGSLAIGGDDKIITFGDHNCGEPCVYIGEQGADDRMVLRAGAYHFSGGNVGIGTSNPQWPLEVITTAQMGSAIAVAAYGSSFVPALLGRKARGTINAPSAVQSGDNLGIFGGTGYHTTGFNTDATGKMSVTATENWIDTALGTAIRFHTTANGSTNTVEQMRINHNGNVGIGTTSPGSLLTVAGTIESTSGGVKFPDGTTQATAATRNPLQVATLRWYEAIQSGPDFATGITPIGVAFDGANMWVTNSGSATVTKLRASDGANLGTFAVGTQPQGVAFDGANIWAANTGGDTVTKLRASDGVCVGGACTFAVGDGPVGVAFDGANIWVANFNSNTVTKLRASDGACVGTCTFAVGTNPFGVAFDGANIWVANYSSANVTKLRASDGACVGTCTFAVGTNPRGVAFDGANIWVANNNSNNVTKLRASDGACVGTCIFAVGTNPAEVAFDGANIWVANGSSANVTKLRASDGACVGTCTFAVGTNPRGVAFDGANIWVTNSGSGSVSKR